MNDQTNEQIRNQVSEYMDGELSRDSARFLARRLAGEAELRNDWMRWHYVRDCLRGHATRRLDDGLAARIAASIADDAAPAVPLGARVLRWTGGFAVAASVALAALVLERYRFRGKLTFDAVLYLPIIIPDIVMALSTLLFFVILAIPLSRNTVLIAHVAFNISFVAVVVRARLADMDKRLEEAAADLGANEWTTFRRVTLPLLMPGIVAGALLAFTLSLDDFVITFFVAGPGSTTLPVRVYSMIKFGVTPEVNAISTLMLVGSTLLVVISLLLQRREA